MVQQGKGGKKPVTSHTTQKSRIKKTPASGQAVREKITSWLIYTVAISIIAPYGIKILILFFSSSLSEKKLWEILIATFSDGGLGIIAVVIAAEAMGKLIRYNREETQHNTLLDILGFFIVCSIIAASLIFGLLSIGSGGAFPGQLIPIDVGKVTVTSMVVFLITLFVWIITIIITKGSE